MQAERAAWTAQQPGLDVTTLVFLDETGVSTNMTRLRGRAPVGERCLASVPHGHWKTTTFIAGLRVGAVTAPMVLDGPLDGEAFHVYVREVLCPTLAPGDLVIADNLRSHTIAAARDLIAGTGAELRFLPPYSPDFNPIEKLFSKLKALLRKAAHRTVDALWEELGTCLDTVSPRECAKYFTACGYVST